MSEPPREGLGSAAAPDRPVALWEIFRAFFTLGVTSFGGGVVAYLRQQLVVRERWLDEETFLAGLELSQILPGLNATNMSVYVGERLRGPAGAFVACLGMMLPGTVIVMLLGVALAGSFHLPDISSVLVGVGSAAVGLLLATTWRIAQPVVANAKDVVIVAATFVAVAFLHVSLVVVLLTIAPLAVWIYHPRRAPEGGYRVAPGEHDR